MKSELKKIFKQANEEYRKEGLSKAWALILSESININKIIIANFNGIKSFFLQSSLSFDLNRKSDFLIVHRCFYCWQTNILED